MIPVRIFVFLIAVLASTVSAGTTPEGIQFLEAKKLEEGVVETASGLLYKEIRPGSGKTPTENSPCSCHYAGRLIDGTEFDSSYKRGAPLSFAPNQVIKGWTEAMQLMKEGAKWELYIKSELGYGERGAGAKIPGGAVLVFDLELLEVKGDFVKDQ
jgi:FKBP-type peptidyl-prolyl cis-trans isomerase FklB